MKSSPDDESKTNPDYTAKPCSDYESRSGEFDGKPSADCASNDSGHGLSRSESDKVRFLKKINENNVGDGDLALYKRSCIIFYTTLAWYT